ENRTGKCDPLIPCCGDRLSFSLPPCGGGPGWGVRIASDVASASAPHPSPPPRGGRESNHCNAVSHRSSPGRELGGNRSWFEGRSGGSPADRSKLRPPGR